jgi:uncharacterized protein YutE (UPF0331/DUF86 family)
VVDLELLTEKTKLLAHNVIVHDYARIDPEILIGILWKNIDDLRLFARMVRDRFLPAS